MLNFLLPFSEISIPVGQDQWDLLVMAASQPSTLEAHVRLQSAPEKPPQAPAAGKVNPSCRPGSRPQRPGKSERWFKVEL